MSTSKPEHLVSIKDLAGVMGVTADTIKKSWLKLDPPCPSVKRGRLRLFDVDEVNAWRQTHSVTGQPGRPSKQSPEQRQLNDKLILERIRKLKLDNDTKAGLLIDAAAEQARDLAKVQFMKKALLDAASKWAADLDGMTLRERETFLKCEVNHLLQEFAR